jgi:hypothetical protein
VVVLVPDLSVASALWLASVMAEWCCLAALEARWLAKCFGPEVTDQDEPYQRLSMDLGRGALYPATHAPEERGALGGGKTDPYATRQERTPPATPSRSTP